eukprot:TRINITY_DN4041_c0_g1_i3.p2 TRINITY_DN4041_c0_g1~~TRINITY_DN4041_c0_g1_i3.p2  ORF type:complete len:134 (-),score=44.04 TRINITY_DN4041_c0_g1_i3:538-939(-)
MSGDTIAYHLSRYFRPEFVVFLTDVDGVYDRNPKEDPSALFFPSFTVNSHGELSAENTTESSVSVQTSCNGNDVTGGMRKKLDSAIEIVLLNEKKEESEWNPFVIITKMDGEGSKDAMRGISPTKGTTLRRKS